MIPIESKINDLRAFRIDELFWTTSVRADK
jgi:hypothetical protein